MSDLQSLLEPYLELLRPYTSLIPPWLENALIQIYGPEIYYSLIYDLRPFDRRNQLYLQLFAQKSAELVLRSGILLPQLLNLARHRRPASYTAILSYIITLVSNIVQIVYGIRSHNGLKVVEYAIQTAQAVIVVFLMLSFKKKPRWGQSLLLALGWLIYWCRGVSVENLQKALSVLNAAGLVNYLFLLTNRRRENLASLGSLGGSLFQNVAANAYLLLGTLFIALGLVKRARSRR
ncbi:hypothetical protein KL925_005023 [Ogataea polymorpha]|uniref:Uncharacterized protein n=1 Tax=Ogataea polymorpha TaxID=460523 RepID=A0A9P8P915_9ASCO|nr:hypothetical protein KL936_004780 [Ogataea polymorpha]KAG7889148.1 hypothetical protein KL908_004948 [Ogataea polymorpha]KAG7897861.1 hypothetical protein KL935_004736 [Ogataea polymorpha]KAG7900067.1 hypothetical protein KL907_004829 [Ogataea polymorpha]KAG7914003.1 hypothetical protein KL927_004982 [Ogataea polymorpha]